MVWQRMLRRLAGSQHKRSGVKNRRRRPTVEVLTRRELLAADIGAISGVAFIDNDLSGTFNAGDAPIVGVQVEAFEDTNTNGSFDPGTDNSLGTQNTNASGEYRFDSLSPGTHFIQQAAASGATPPPVQTVVVSADDADGETIVSIDTFSSGPQVVVAAGGATVDNSQAAGNALGGERDVQLMHTNASGNTTFQVDTGTQIMSLSTGGGATSEAIVEYDGVDGAFGLNVPPGFTGADFDGPAPTQPNVGLELLVRAENQAENLVVTVYSSATAASSATVVIPQNAALQSVFQPFTGFAQSAEPGIASPADLSNIIAVRVGAEVTLADNDIRFSVVESRGPAPITNNLTNVPPQVDLEIVKDLNAASDVRAGGTAIFDVTVTNIGPDTATGIIVTDVIPAGLTFDSIQNASGAFAVDTTGLPTITVDVGTLNSTEVATFQIVTDIAANQTSDITNTSSVAGNETDPVPGNNNNDALVDLTAADLVITKTDSTDPVNAGNQLVYTITVTNQGPDLAEAVVATDTLPADVTFDSFTFTTGNGNVTEGPAGTLTITMGDLANGQSSVVDITVDVSPTAASPLNNVATVIATPDNDPTPGNNDTSEPTNVDRVVDIGVTKTVTGTPVAGSTTDRVTYTIVVNNVGPGEARDVMVTDTLDSRMTFNSFDAGTSGVSLAQAGQDLTFDVGTLAVNQSLQFTFDVNITSAAQGVIPNTAAVTTSDTDSNAANDDSTVNVNVLNNIDLIIEKTVDRATAVPGQDQLVYSFTVRHDTDSPSDAFNVVVTDQFPTGTTGAVISAPTATSTSFDPATQTATVNFDTIPAGETRTFTITVDTNEDAIGTLVNPASVASDGTELDTSNNSDNASTDLTPEFDVTLTKTPDDATPNTGQNVVYTVQMTNAGPSTATGVILTDDIPTGLTFVSGTLNGQAATSNGTTVSFPAITLGANQSQSAALTFSVDASASGDIINTASVTTNAGETDTTNNDANATVTVTPETDIRIEKSVNQTSAQAGNTLVYTMTVTNDGPSNAVNVIATDTLPSGVTFVSGSGPNGEALTANNGVVTVNGGALANGANFQFTINATVNSGITADQTNTVSVTTDTVDTDSNNDQATVVTTIDPVTASIAGTVYIDANNNGVQDAGETGIAGATLTLTGTDSQNNSVSRQATTDANGDYIFANLAEGTYDVQETQPVGFRDGQETAGTGALTSSTADDVFTDVGLAPAGTAIDFNFGELNEALSKRRFLASS